MCKRIIYNRWLIGRLCCRNRCLQYMKQTLRNIVTTVFGIFLSHSSKSIHRSWLLFQELKNYLLLDFCPVHLLMISLYEVTNIGTRVPMHRRTRTVRAVQIRRAYHSNERIDVHSEPHLRYNWLSIRGTRATTVQYCTVRNGEEGGHMCTVQWEEVRAYPSYGTLHYLDCMTHNTGRSRGGTEYVVLYVDSHWYHGYHTRTIDTAAYGKMWQTSSHVLVPMLWAICKHIGLNMCTWKAYLCTYMHGS